MAVDSLNISLISDVIRKAIKPLTRDYGEIIYLQSSHNGTANFASRAASKVESIIVSELQNSRSNYPISNITAPVDTDAEYRWLIDPMDGLLNFAHAIPFFAVSIALQKKIGNNFETIAAIIEAPAFEESYIAERGSGAWLDNYSRFSKGRMRMRVSNRVKSDEILVLDDEKNFGSEILAMAFIAAGKIDSVKMKNVNENRASIAKLFIEEAGGFYELSRGKLHASNRKVAE